MSTFIDGAPPSVDPAPGEDSSGGGDEFGRDAGGDPGARLPRARGAEESGPTGPGGRDTAPSLPDRNEPPASGAADPADSGQIWLYEQMKARMEANRASGGRGGSGRGRHARSDGDDSTTRLNVQELLARSGRPVPPTMSGPARFARPGRDRYPGTPGGAPAAPYAASRAEPAGSEETLPVPAVRPAEPSRPGDLGGASTAPPARAGDLAGAAGARLESLGSAAVRTGPPVMPAESSVEVTSPSVLPPPSAVPPPTPAPALPAAAAAGTPETAAPDGTGPSAVDEALALEPPVRPDEAAQPEQPDPVGARFPETPGEPKRVRVVLSERKGVARSVRTVVDIQEGTAVGALLSTNLIRNQLTVALRVAAVAVLALGLLPALFALFPGIGRTELLGLRVPWLLLGVLVYPFLLGLGWWHTRAAERVEQDFAEDVQD